MSENIGRYFLGSVVDPSNDFDFQAGRSFVAWTGFYRGSVVDPSNDFDFQAGRSFVAWTGFYKGEKKVFTFSKK